MLRVTDCHLNYKTIHEKSLLWNNVDLIITLWTRSYTTVADLRYLRDLERSCRRPKEEEEEGRETPEAFYESSRNTEQSACVTLFMS